MFIRVIRERSSIEMYINIAAIMEAEIREDCILLITSSRTMSFGLGTHRTGIKHCMNYYVTYDEYERLKKSLAAIMLAVN